MSQDCVDRKGYEHNLPLRSAAPTKKVDVHAPPKNMGELKVAEKLREKMETMRETRRLARKLGAVPTLGEEEEEDDNSASAWVQRIKRKEEERKAAERRARLLQEMEEEFGVGELVEETLREDKAKVSLCVCVRACVCVLTVDTSCRPTRLGTSRG